ncbi:MAG: hypothetical protein H7263_11180 [Candidatus Sericytochromatia bacterium]|nr:hypothetical protein [Candidatus Sericytochromatia bacterium]
MFKTKWICCLQQTNQFIAEQADIFEDATSIFYDEYNESLAGIETCYRCKATYASYMIVEFTIPKIYFHIPISIESYQKFHGMDTLLKDDLFNAKETEMVLIETEMGRNSIWEWSKISESMWGNM